MLSYPPPFWTITTLNYGKLILNEINLTKLKRNHCPKERGRVFGNLLSPGKFSAQSAGRIVSCYTLFKGWLPLSQPSICLWRTTAFNT